MEKYLENTLFIGKPILHFSILDSTNDYAKLLLTNNTPKNGTVILADYQSEGRGQQDNSWESEEGKNLLFSLILYPKLLPAEQQFFMNMAICNGIIEGLSYLVKIPKLSIKWPNDIMIGDRKLAGILIENAISGIQIKYAVVGIGINIYQCNWKAIDTAISLGAYIPEGHLSRWQILESILIAIERNYYLLERGKHNLIKDTYMKHLYRHDGHYHQFRRGDKEFAAKILDVCADGRLKLLEEYSQSVGDYVLKEIKFI